MEDFNPENKEQHYVGIPSDVEHPKNPGDPVSYDYYFRIMNSIFENIGENTKLHQMASLLCDRLGIPSGPVSALSGKVGEQDKETGIRRYERSEEDKERDRIIGSVFRDIPGVYIGEGLNKLREQAPIVTMDINQILDVLERDGGKDGSHIEIYYQTFLDALSEKDRRIIEGERKLRGRVVEKFAGSEKITEQNRPLIYFRLSGGVSVFLRGYMHDGDGFWQEDIGNDLSRIYSVGTSVVAIEGSVDRHLGESLNPHWKSIYNKSYPVLMRGIAELNPEVLFTEVDARDMSQIHLEHNESLNFIELPDQFYGYHYNYLLKLNPGLVKLIPDPKTLKEMLKKQSTTFRGTDLRDLIKLHIQTRFRSHPSVTSDLETSSFMTGLELGTMMFSDALSAIKLHMMSRLSADGHLREGPIVDIQGSDHLSGKTFFMQFPQYAMMVVLMNIQELLAGRADEIVGKEISGNIEKAFFYGFKIFESPNWQDTVTEILRLAVFKVKGSFLHTVKPGWRQKKLKDITPDYAKIYGIDIKETAKKLDELFNQS